MGGERFVVWVRGVVVREMGLSYIYIYIYICIRTEHSSQVSHFSNQGRQSRNTAKLPLINVVITLTQPN